MSPSILVVDDEPDTCANLRDILTEYGYRVDTANEGETALELAQRHAYDVALLDFMMPGINGVELLRRLRSANQVTVGLMLTAHANPETTYAARAAGAWRILPKPVDIPRLLADLDQALLATRRWTLSDGSRGEGRGESLDALSLERGPVADRSGPEGRSGLEGRGDRNPQAN